MGKVQRKRNTRVDKINFNRKQIIEIRALAGVGMTVENIAEYFGVSKSTMDRRIRESTELQDALRVGRSKAQATVYKSAYNMAKSERHSDFTKWYLGARYNWSNKEGPQVAVQVNVNPEHKFIDSIKNMSTEELQGFVEQGRKRSE